LKWFALWAYLAASIAVVTSEQIAFYNDLDIGVTASMGAETGLAVIQWLVVAQFPLSRAPLLPWP